MSEKVLGKLVAGIEAMQLTLPDNVPQQLIDYLGLLTHWNRAFNLTAVREPEEMVSKHLLDSLAVLPHIGEGRFADIGSGAGLPGIPLALALPQVEFVLLDSNGKKTRFLKQAKMVLKLDNVEVIHQRVQDYLPSSEGHRIYFDGVIARAYASTRDILDTTKNLHHPQTRILIMQGKLDDTVDTPGYRLLQSHSLDVYGLNAERHLLEIVKN